MQLRLLELEYTILRPAWLTDEDIIDYELTSRNEPFKGTNRMRGGGGGCGGFFSGFFR